MYQNGTFRRISELFQSHNILILALSATLTTACSASLTDPAPAESNRQQAQTRMGNDVTDSGLPISKRFRSLDDYLAHLEQTQGPVDGPWYKEVSPGIYELQTGGNLHLDVPSNEKRTFTRKELEKKFGFSN